MECRVWHTKKGQKPSSMLIANQTSSSYQTVYTLSYPYSDCPLPKIWTILLCAASFKKEILHPGSNCASELQTWADGFLFLTLLIVSHLITSCLHQIPALLSRFVENLSFTLTFVVFYVFSLWECQVKKNNKEKNLDTVFRLPFIWLKEAAAMNIASMHHPVKALVVVAGVKWRERILRTGLKYILFASKLSDREDFLFTGDL